MPQFQKGAAELIAVILVIAVAMSATLFVGLFFSKFTSNQTEIIDSKTGYVDCGYANIIFDTKDVFINKTDNGYANVTIRNSGSVNLTNFSVIIFKGNVFSELSVVSSTQRTEQNPLLPGNVFRLESTGNILDATRIKVFPGNCPFAAREVAV